MSIETTQNDAVNTRKVRPWIAAALTFLGFGVGLFYARHTRAAIYVCIAQILVMLAATGVLLTVLYFNGPSHFSIWKPTGNFPLSNAANLLLSAIVAVGVWIFVARRGGVVEKAGPSRLLGYVGIYLLPIVCSVVAALLMRNFWLQPFHNPSASMRPALETDHYFVISKWSYGYSRASIAPLGNLLPQGRVFSHQPKRGDIVVFKNRNDGNKDYIKRVVGMPGDTIQMAGGYLLINGQPVKKELLGMKEAICDFDPAPAPTYRETLPNGVSYLVQECSGDDGALDNVGPYKVPPDSYFMLGDNRDRSQDSRIIAHVGFVPFDSLVGKAALGPQ